MRRDLRERFQFSRQSIVTLPLCDQISRQTSPPIHIYVRRGNTTSFVVAHTTIQLKYAIRIKLPVTRSMALNFNFFFFKFRVAESVKRKIKSSWPKRSCLERERKIVGTTSKPRSSSKAIFTTLKAVTGHTKRNEFPNEPFQGYKSYVFCLCCGEK